MRSASARSRVPRKLTSAPSARSASATAIAGTTCPAVPPAAITTRATCCAFPPAVWAALDHAQSRRAPGRGAAPLRARPARRSLGRRAPGHAQDQAGGGKGEHQAGPSIGDEWQRNARERREAEDGEEVERRL